MYLLYIRERVKSVWLTSDPQVSFLQSVKSHWQFEVFIHWPCNSWEKTCSWWHRLRRASFHGSLTTRIQCMQRWMASIIAKSSRISWLSSYHTCDRLNTKTTFRSWIALVDSTMKGSIKFHISHAGINQYDRWNDASVQTLAAAMFLPQNQLHFFNHIGYTFERQTHCPWRNNDLGTCGCDITSATGK